MKKLLKFCKSNIKVVVALLIGGLLAGGSVYAATVIASSSISYNNSSSELSSTNLQDALDEAYEKAAKKIIVAYTFDETNCINWEEATCVENTCYESTTAGSCSKGTIIKYRVNDNDVKVFYVLHDDGDTITMQQRENTITTAWYNGPSAASGPTTALYALENATANWTNVNDQTYTMGTTEFASGLSAYTGCSTTYVSQVGKTYVSCNTNTYKLSTRTAKARMITAPEASSAGCSVDEGNCQKWLNIDTSTSYWTMNVYPGRTANSVAAAWVITTQFDYKSIPSSYVGARAVVVVNK